MRAAGEEGADLGDGLGVARLVDATDARRRAPLDLVLQARPRPALEHGVAAVAQGKGAQERIERLVDRAGRGEGAEILGVGLLGAAVLADLREAVAVTQIDVGERLVVPEHDVEHRLEALDEVGLEQERLDLAGAGDELHLAGQRDHPRDALGVALSLGVGGDPLLEVLGLADVEDVALGVEHAVDAGRVRQMPHLRRDELGPFEAGRVARAGRGGSGSSGGREIVHGANVARRTRVFNAAPVSWSAGS